MSCTSLNSYNRWKPSASQQVTIVPHSQEWRCNTDKSVGLTDSNMHYHRLLSRLWQNQKKQKLSAITPMVCKSSQGQCNRVDVVFDCYNQLSIKNATRKHRAGRGHGVKCDISSRDLKLPEQWKNFFGVNENKSTLVKFLKNELLPHAQAGKKELVVSGRNEGSAASSTSRNMDHLSSIQEEADTRMVLHACEAKAKGYKRTVVISSDTDVLVLLIAFYPQLSAEVWMKA